MENTTKARRRMDNLIRHLTDGASPESFSVQDPRSLNRLKLRRELASAQRERVLQDYGYELQDEKPVSKSPFRLIDESPTIEAIEEDFSNTLSHFLDPLPSENKPDDVVIDTNSVLFRVRCSMAKACKLAVRLHLVKHNDAQDTMSCFVPNHGYLLKPLTVRFDEVSPQCFRLVKRPSELPAMHKEIYTSIPSSFTCIISSRNEACEMVSISRDGLLPLCQESVRIHGHVQRVEKENLGLRAMRLSHSNVHSWLVKQEGVLCLGTSFEMCLSRMLWVTRACEFQVRALSSVGGDLNRLDVLSTPQVLKAQSELVCSNEEAAKHVFELGS